MVYSEGVTVAHLQSDDETCSMQLLDDTEQIKEGHSTTGDHEVDEHHHRVDEDTKSRRQPRARE